MKTVTLPSGETVPALGLGTWMMAEDRAHREAELRALQHGIDLGLTLLDTAEMYGDGASEILVGQAIRGRREQVFLVSKVYPHNAGRRSLPQACARSLKRLGVDCLDLYLLHWPGAIPVAETVEAFERLRAQGKIRHWGVSNLDLPAMRALMAVTDGGQCAANQVLYNLSRRGIEWDLLPWCQARGIPLMAYSPLEQARLLHHPELAALARALSATPASLALAWLLQREGVIAIPKTGRSAHVDQFAQALELPIAGDVAARLDQLFPPPETPQPLEML